MNYEDGGSKVKGMANVAVVLLALRGRRAGKLLPPARDPLCLRY